MQPQLLFIALGGALGALMRYATAVGISYLWRGAFPMGTAIANVLGCFLIGLVLPYFAKTEISAGFRLFFVTGFLGAYTTFSTFSLETLALVQRSDYTTALLNVMASLGLGFGATALGIWAGKTFWAG
ncbi:MAG: fluoride efflux transporter CrcB [Bacteroidetes Order II. Incertae sedis bacterium]|nr:fluoride efflux transporter CrcB [Bacteroidetes Order II. bacterium]